MNQSSYLIVFTIGMTKMFLPSKKMGDLKINK